MGSRARTVLFLWIVSAPRLGVCIAFRFIVRAGCASGQAGDSASPAAVLFSCNLPASMHSLLIDIEHHTIMKFILAHHAHSFNSTALSRSVTSNLQRQQDACRSRAQIDELAAPKLLEQSGLRCLTVREGEREKKKVNQLHRFGGGAEMGADEDSSVELCGQEPATRKETQNKHRDELPLWLQSALIAACAWLLFR